MDKPRVHVMVRIPWGHLNASPFCEKVLVYAKLASIEVEEVRDLSPKRGPKGKYPWMEDGDTTLGDSEAIVDYLRERHGDPLGDRAVPDEVKSRCHLVRRVLEESVYFALIAERYQDPGVWPHFSADLQTVVAKPLGAVLVPIVRRDLRAIMRAQGYGRHSVEEVRRMATDDFAAVAAILGDQPFFAGDEPHAIDATAFGFLSSFLETPHRTPIGHVVAGHDNLVAFHERMRARLSSEGAD